MKSKFTIAAVAVLVAGTSAWAQKAAVIDMQGAILQTKDGQKASVDLKAKFGPKEQEIAKRSQDLVAKQTEFQKTAATLSDTARANMQRDIENIQKALKRDTDDAQADVQADENRLLGAIMQKMQAVMQKYAVDKQLSVILDISSQPNNLLYADKSVNVTAEIIALYDKEAAAPMSSVPATPKPSAPPAAAPKKPATPGTGKQ